MISSLQKGYWIPYLPLPCSTKTDWNSDDPLLTDRLHEKMGGDHVFIGSSKKAALWVVHRVCADDPRCTKVKIKPHGYLTKSQIQRLLEGLKLNTHVKQLTLSGLRLDDDQGYLLADALAHNNVEVLDVSQNYFSELAIRRIVQAVTDRKVLKVLWMTGQQRCSFSTEVMEQIASILEQNDTLLFIFMDLPAQNAEALKEICNCINSNVKSGPARETYRLSDDQNDDHDGGQGDRQAEVHRQNEQS